MFFSIIFTGIILALLSIPARGGSELTWKFVIIGFFMLVFILVLIHLFSERKKYDPNDSPLINAIQYKNGDAYFTWIYPFKHIYNGVPSYYLVFMAEDKKKYQVRVKTEEEFGLISSFQVLIQNVTYGYSDELKKQYKKDPKALLRHGYRCA